MKSTNFTGLTIYLLAPFVYYTNMFVFVRIDEKFLGFSSWINLVFSQSKVKEMVAFYVYALLFFVVTSFMVWQLTKRLKNPELPDKFMMILIGLFGLKGIFANFMRFAFNPWISLWLFAPFLLLACARGEGWQYLKKYLWYPIMLDGLVLIYGYWVGNLSETLKGVTVVDLMILLLAYIALFIGFVKYTTWTYDPAKPRWYIPTVILAIPAFTIGLFITFLFLIMF